MRKLGSRLPSSLRLSPISECLNGYVAVNRCEKPVKRGVPWISAGSPLSTFALGICRPLGRDAECSANCVARHVSSLHTRRNGRPYRVLTRSPLIPAVPLLIAGLQDADKIGHAGSIPVFGHDRSLSIRRGPAPLPTPREEIGDVFHGALSATKCGSGH